MCMLPCHFCVRIIIIDVHRPQRLHRVGTFNTVITVVTLSCDFVLTEFSSRFFFLSLLHSLHLSTPSLIFDTRVVDPKKINSCPLDPQWFTEGGQPHNPTDEPWLQWLVDVANTTGPIPLVFSASYTDFESHVDPAYAQRVNIELCKIGLRGTSLLMASGDYGIGTLYLPSSGGYHPEFPASSPWVTSVGGTMFGDKKTNVAVEQVWNDDSYGSGGGFSNAFARPAYQDAAVAAWYARAHAAGTLPQNASWWNRTGRAYPDVAVLATPYQTVCSGFVQTGTGTSASTPTMSGIVSLLNEHRLAAGKSSLGFLNPLLYKVLGPAGALTDVTEGCNPGFQVPGQGASRLPGFSADVGFDPASGWGVPNFPKLLEEVMKLP